MPRIGTIKARELREAGKKWCPYCQSVKPLADFCQHKGKSNNRTGTYCLLCQADYARGRAFPSNGASYSRNKELQWERRLIKKFGVTAEAYYNMLSAQGGVCAICRRVEVGKRLAVDHNHKTSTVRALLCGRCNPAVGFLLDDPLLAEKFVAYLKLHEGDK